MPDYKALYIEALKKWDDNICEKCQNNPGVCPENCPHSFEGVYEIPCEGEFLKMNITCEDLAWGDCARLRNTPCHGCLDNNFSGFVLKEESCA